MNLPVYTCVTLQAEAQVDTRVNINIKVCGSGAALVPAFGCCYCCWIREWQLGQWVRLWGRRVDAGSETDLVKRRNQGSEIMRSLCTYNYKTALLPCDLIRRL